MKVQLPKINGLVLAGGKSSRMGQSKGAIPWHGQEQHYFVAQLMKDFCHEVFISCRQEQKEYFNESCKLIVDQPTYSGPMAGMLAAFQTAPEIAWLVVACDLPLLDKNTISFLMKKRDALAIATAFVSPYDSLPEPLIAIWEPASFDVLKKAQSSGQNCPRKVLINNHPHLLTAPYPEALINANTPQDREKVNRMLKNIR